MCSPAAWPAWSGCRSCSAAHSYGHTSRPGSASPGSRSPCSGRNQPVGIVFGALLWAFLDTRGNPLDLESVPKEIVTIMQGVIVLPVVVAYEVVAPLTGAAERSVGAAGRARRAGRPAEPGGGGPTSTSPRALAPARVLAPASRLAAVGC